MTRLRKLRNLTENQQSRNIHPQELLRAGDWHQYFGKSGDIWLEVGTGKDTHLIERSILNPDDLHVGLELTRKKFEMMLRKADSLTQELPNATDNLRFMNADAFQTVEACFKNASLSGAFILFPDPWPKKRHKARRLLQKSFLQLITTKLAPDAVLEIRTDDPDYAVQAKEALSEISELRSLTGSIDWIHEPLDPTNHVETLFESKFKKRGLKIHHFYLFRTSDVTP